jgi:glutathione reductase (NADPH)
MAWAANRGTAKTAHAETSFPRTLSREASLQNGSAFVTNFTHNTSYQSLIKSNNPPKETKMTFDFDFVVIGGGSGGIATAKRAAVLHGKKVALIERARWGGTCVNVGCVPKKLMWVAATMAETMKHDVGQYCFEQPKVNFDMTAFKKKRDAYIVKLNNIYEGGLGSSGVTKIIGDATFENSHTLRVTAEDGSTSTITAEHILIATGGRPDLPTTPGMDLAITSDGFFELEILPKKAVVVGAGYIAVELAGVLNGLGVDTHLVVRQGKALRTFDDDISDHLDFEMQRQGITIHRNTRGVANIELDSATGLMTVQLLEGSPIFEADIVLMAPGRLPNTETLNLDKVGVSLIPGKTYIQVDDYQNTSASNIYALGDVCGAVELTPMAIAAGRRLADRIFGGVTNSKVSYELVPTVVFSHPTIGTIGMTERQAVQKYGQDNIKVYKSRFPNLYYGPFSMDSDEKPKTLMKLVCAGKTELVVGLHIIGMGADEMLQGFGVAMKMGATKADFDSSIAIHPTGAEELVTMGTWGASPQFSGAKESPLMGASPPEPTL